jgi:endonuclease/exonuclease/phosphatase family metal-dependent hydrolase
VVITVGIVLLGCLLILVGLLVWASSGGYPRDRYAEVVTYNTVKSSANTEAITIVSYNIGYLSGLTNNQAVERDSQLLQRNLQATIAAFTNLQPEIIGLQEVDIASRRSFDINQADALAEKLGLSTGAIAINWDKRYVPFPYFPPAAHFGRIVSGQAVLSRYSIQSHERIVLERVPTQPFWYRAFYLDRVAQVLQLQIHNQPIVVINVHLEAFDAPTRLRQTEVIRQLYDRYAATYPVLLLGDFNSNPPWDGASSTLEPLLSAPQLQSVIPLTSDGPRPLSFPSDRPVALLDYIFYNADRWHVSEAQVFTDVGQASDHLPIMARMKLR